jgi:hypothetical protein
MGLVLSIYALSVLALVTLSSLVTSFIATLWILGIFHTLCAFGVIILWWIEDRWWSWDVTEEGGVSAVPTRSTVPFIKAVPRSPRRTPEQ